MPTRFNHVQLSWFHPGIGPLLEVLSSSFRLINYDARGQGMSTRGLSQDFEVAHFEDDLTAVLHKLQIDSAVLVGAGSAGRTAIRFAVRNPERVAALVLLNAVRASPPVVMRELARHNWLQFLELLPLPTGTSPDQRRAAKESHQSMVTQADLLVIMDATLRHAQENLAPQLRVPTLVLHSRDFGRLDLRDSTRLAAEIPNARLTMIEGTDVFGDARDGLRAIEMFLADLPPAAERPATPPAASPPGGLSEREVEVLRLLAQGKSNPQIAQELFITRSTVQNHVSSILIKLNLQNRAQAAVYAQQYGLV
jgi:DNA-binding CsgD family transcriptional regulator/pimeloyl-ACP methyl ester carboxylesterase